MNPQEEQDLIDDHLGGEICDDCSNGPEDHAIGIDPSGNPFVDCTND